MQGALRNIGRKIKPSSEPPEVKNEKYIKKKKEKRKKRS